MADGLSLLPVVVLLAGLVSAAFIRYLWPYRKDPGGWFFIATIAAETLWIVAYGIALLIFDPGLRQWFEIPIWIGANFIGVFFLAFALEYTGRSSIVRSPVMAGLLGLQLIHTGIVVTNPWHQIAWRSYEIVPLFGAATVTYDHTVWLAINFSGILLMVSAGVFLLFDTFFSYGRLYRDQAAAIALSPVLPGLAFLIWLLQIGITPPLNLTPLTFPFHLGFVFYAFFRRNMFDMTPAARRASERSGIEDLGSAVIVVDDGNRMINLNTEAERVLGHDEHSLLGEPLEAYLPNVDPHGDGGSITLSTDQGRRDYAVTTGALFDAGEREVGYTIVLQDITREKQREQRLGVLNRVLRHNLRNDLNIVEGYIKMVREAVDDDRLTEMLETAAEKTTDVITLGEKAREIEEALSTDDTADTVDLAELLADIATTLESEFPNSEIDIEVPAGRQVRGSPGLLEAVFSNLLENALEHNPAENAKTTVRMVEHDQVAGTASFVISDNGPGIPQGEFEVLEAEEETSLEHGSGLGLWVVTWGIRSLGGEISFETGEGGSSVTLVLPTPKEASGSQSD